MQRWLGDFRRMGEGERVMALAAIRARPTAGALDAVTDGLLQSRSAFEQYQALRAAHNLLPQLDAQGRERLRTAVGEALDGRGSWALGPDRTGLAKDLLDRLQ